MKSVMKSNVKNVIHKTDSAYYVILDRVGPQDETICGNPSSLPHAHDYKKRSAALHVRVRLYLQNAAVITTYTAVS
jgi:hypothetical protein